jgi:hypothetical protein
VQYGHSAVPGSHSIDGSFVCSGDALEQRAGPLKCLRCFSQPSLSEGAKRARSDDRTEETREAEDEVDAEGEDAGKAEEDEEEGE